MTRMESIRRQYENTPQPKQNQPPRGAGRVYPRFCFWRWFWLLFLVTLLIGFFSCKSTILPWCKAKFGGGNAASTGSSLSLIENQLGAVSSSDIKVAAQKLSEYIVPSEAEMNQLFEYVRNSAHVKENKLYATIMNSTLFGFDQNDNVVNAYAGVRSINGTDTPVIIYLGGAARFNRVASLAIAAEMCSDKGAGARFVSALKPADLSKMDAQTVARIIQEANLIPALLDETVMSKAKSISAGMILGIIAHEAGHQSLGHCMKTGSTVNYEISRNQEREADSFSSSVIASSPFGEYILAGTLFWHYALANQQQDVVATTHPLSKERFENFVRANAELAASLGVKLK